MGKVLDKIQAQIKRDGKLPEHLEVLKLYNLLLKCNLRSTLMWNEMVNYKYNDGKYTLSVKPEIKLLFKEW